MLREVHWVNTWWCVEMLWVSGARFRIGLILFSPPPKRILKAGFNLSLISLSFGFTLKAFKVSSNYMLSVEIQHFCVVTVLCIVKAKRNSYCFNLLLWPLQMDFFCLCDSGPV